MKSDASELGALLVDYAKGPVRLATAHLGANRVAEALAALSHDNLLAGLREGVAQTAKRVRIDPSEVDRVLPWNDLSPLLLRIKSSQQAALEIWAWHADSVGGLLTGFAGTKAADGARRSNAGEPLKGLANRFVRDEQIADPIKAFAADVLQWEEILVRCADCVDRADLGAGYRRRRLILLVSTALLGICLCSAVGVIMAQRFISASSRERIEHALAGAEACSVETIAPKDMGYALPDQASRVQMKKGECAKIRARANYEGGCESLAGHLEAGQLTSEDEELLKSSLMVMRRVAKGALEPVDFLFPEADMPCQDVPKAADRLWRAYAKAAADSSAAWAQTDRTDKVSEKLRSLLAAKDMRLSATSKQELSKRAEESALKAIISGKPDEMVRAKGLCDFNVPFSVDNGRNCKGVATAMGVRP